MSDSQLDWKLLKELECPVCMEYMASPIKMCENGHNICGGCKERLSECPSCRGKFVSVRNVTLENLAATAVYPCKNRETGCEETFTVDGRNKHLSVCVYQRRKCPVSIMLVVDCNWTGTLSDILVHILAEHERVIAEVPGHFNVKLLDLDRGRVYTQLVLVLGEFFWLVWGSGLNEFGFTVWHVGLNEASETFKYGIKMGNSEEYIAGARKCRSYLDVDLTRLQPRKSVATNYDTVLDFVNESGCLSCEIEIGREKLEGFVLEELQEHLPVVYVVSSELD
jgi:hypothetical protein